MFLAALSVAPQFCLIKLSFAALFVGSLASSLNPFAFRRCPSCLNPFPNHTDVYRLRRRPLPRSTAQARSVLLQSVPKVYQQLLDDFSHSAAATTRHIPARIERLVRDK